MTLISNTKQFNGMYDNANDVRQAVLAEVGRYHQVATTGVEVEQFFEELGMDTSYIGGDTEQQFDVLGIEEEGGWIPTFSVKIESHYVDSGSEDYIFTVSVYER